MRHQLQRQWFRTSIMLLCTLLLPACAVPASLPVDPFAGQATPVIAPAEGGMLADATPYLRQSTIDPTTAEYFDLIDGKLALTADERTLLTRNGFVVSDRLQFADFRTAYAYIYWQDLPVLITTDSMLQAIHKTYDDLLERTEVTIVVPKLRELLVGIRSQLQATARGNQDKQLALLYQDLDVYLEVPLALLAPYGASPTISSAAQPYLAQVRAASEFSAVTLFGSSRTIDFTLLQPRGHYTKSEEMEHYFQAMSWLAQVDFRMVEHDPSGAPMLNLSQVAAAAMLADAIDASGQHEAWEQLDALFGLLVGRSDNTTLPDLQRFVRDIGNPAPGALLQEPEPDRILNQLETHDYGQQRITGQLLVSNQNSSTPLPRPVSFLLFGQRFALDAYVMSNLVYDRLIVDNAKVERPFPSPLDVEYALGNDRAATHVQDELVSYGYASQLETLRHTVNTLEPTFWQGSVYNRWLDVLRTLNEHTTDAQYPQAMRTSAWADKMLHTQLASWAQLRHDNLLYAKQSVTGIPLCEYPAGYVEPYPAFYQAIVDYARAGTTLFTGLDINALGGDAQVLRDEVTAYFAHLDAVAQRLQSMAEKELRHEPWNAEEQAFLRNTAVRKVMNEDTCAGVFEREEWAGWYPRLFPWGDDSPALIADVHTNPSDELPPAGVLHVATGAVAATVMVADTPDGAAVYVGPAFTYYQFIEKGAPPRRLTDEQWQQRLVSDERPEPPAWTRSFRLSVREAPTSLVLPTAQPVEDPLQERFSPPLPTVDIGPSYPGAGQN